MLKILKEGYAAVIDASKTALVFIVGVMSLVFFIIAFGLGIIEIVQWLFL